MFHVTPDGVLVIEIIWEAQVLYIPADFNEEGDRFCPLESVGHLLLPIENAHGEPIVAQLNWTIDARKT